MALGYLFVLFVAILFIAVVGIGLRLFSKNATVKNISFYGLAFLGMLVGFIGATAQPTNFVVQQIYFWLTAALAIVAAIIKLTVKKEKWANIFVIVSVVCGIWNLFL